MAITFRNSSNTGNDQNVSVLAPAVPSSAATDDVMVAFLSRWGPGSNPAVTAPSGFTHVGTQVTSGDGGEKLDVYYKRLTGADTGTYSFSWTGAMWSHLHVLDFIGVKTSGDPIGAMYVSWSGTAGTFGSIGLSPSFAPALAWSCYNDTGGTHTPPTSFTEIIDFDSGSAAYYIPGSSGTYNAANGTASTSSPASAVLIALEPASSAAPAVPIFPISQYGSFH